MSTKSPEMVSNLIATSPIIADPGLGNTRSGVLYAANDSRFEASHFHEGLTSYTTGWKDPNTDYDARREFFAPGIRVSRRFDWRKHDNAEFFATESEKQLTRGIGAPFNKVEYTASMTTARTLNKGLTYTVDHDDEALMEDLNLVVGWLMSRIQRSEYVTALAALATACGAATPKEWDNAVNPMDDIRQAALAAGDSSGIDPNKLLMTVTALAIWASSHEAMVNKPIGVYGALLPNQIAERLGMDGGELIKGRIQLTNTSKKRVGDTTSGTTGAVFLAQAMSGLMKDDASNLKHFWSPARGGGRWGVYTREHVKSTDVTVELYSVNVVASNIGAARLDVTRGSDS